MRYEEILSSSVNDFIMDRINENYSNLIKDKQYLVKQKACKKIMNNLVSKIDINMFEKYKEENNSLQYLELKEIYKLGFKDSMIIFNNKNKKNLGGKNYWKTKISKKRREKEMEKVQYIIIKQKKGG